MEKKQTEPYISTYLHAKGSKLGLPIAGNFELTARCNFNCPMCYVHLTQNDGLAEKELTAEQWIDIAQQARDQGMIFVLLTGGEPFIRKDFFEIYDAIKAMGLLVSINTNGSMLQGEIRRRLLENPPHRINISLYGGNPQTYRDMCGQDAFDSRYMGYALFPDGSWVCDGVAYSSATESVYILEEGKTVTPERMEEMAGYLNDFVRINNLILETNYYKGK